MGLRQKPYEICTEGKERAEKEPIMQCRIADRGLLFGYLGNKMLSLYEDWRELEHSFFSFLNFLSIIFNELMYILILFFIGVNTYMVIYIVLQQMINMMRKGKGNGKENWSAFFFTFSSLLVVFYLFEFLLALSVHSKVMWKIKGLKFFQPRLI